MSDAPISHEEASGLLDAWKEGELDAEEGARVEAHVASCDRCRAVQAALGGGIRAALTKNPTSDVLAQAPIDLLPEVQRKIRLRSRGRFYGEPSHRRAPSPWPLLLGSLAVLALLATAYLLLGQTAGAQSDAPASATSASSK